MKNRNLEVDTLRGIACILLVAYHVIGNSPQRGLQIDGGLYRNLNDLLAYIRMPLFAFLSGIVYSYRPVSKDYFTFFRKKVRRLLFPLLSVGTSFALIQHFTPGTNFNITSWATLHIIPVAHYWFLEAIFIIFCLITICEYFHLFKTLRGFLLLFLAAIFLYVSKIDITVFAICGAIYLLPFFLLGMLFQRYDIKKYLNRKAFFVLLAILFASLILRGTDIIPQYGKRSAFGLAMGLVSCTFFLSSKLKVGLLAYIGYYSYSIYLFHVFLTAAIRMLLQTLDIHNINILFSIGLIVGILGPILLERMLDGTNFTRVLFLGKSTADLKELWITRRLSGRSRAGS